MSVIRPDSVSRQPEPPRAGTDRPSRRPQPTRPPVNGHLFDARFRHLIDHLCSLGTRPVGECFLQLVGTQDDARTALVVLLERYRQLDADVVQAVGGDRWPETIFPVGAP